MEKNPKKLVLLAMLTGIAGVIAVAGLSGSSPRTEPTPAAVAATAPPAPAEAGLLTPLTQNKPEASRVSVSFNDDANQGYALLKGGAASQETSHHPDIDIWYGQYSDQDYRSLPASPLEKEPSRLNVKISIAF